MTILTEGKHTGEYIVSVAEKTRSFDLGTLITGQKLSAGTVLGKITASGKFTILAPAASDGSQTAAAILHDNVDATAADKSATVLVRDAEVNTAELTFPVGITAPQRAAALASLAAAGVIGR